MALSWHAGLLTDHALKVFADPAGPCLYVQDIARQFSWRDLARILLNDPPTMLLWRAVHPTIAKRSTQWAAATGHRDDFGTRYLLTGPELKAFIDHFRHAPRPD